MTSTLRINLWSGPRNVSTALMYSFAQRADTRVCDEPIYGHYLRVTEADKAHPSALEIIDSMISDGQRAIGKVILGPCDRPVFFMKQMAHHLVDIDHGFLAQTANVLLIRDPEQMLPSLIHQLPNAALHDTGLAVQTALYAELQELGQTPPVLDAKQVLLNPRGVLIQLCAQLGIDFDEAMLSWSAGARPEDGVWARHWYQNVHRSTGFAPYRAKTDPFPQHLLPLLAECQPHYEMLAAVAIRA